MAGSRNDFSKQGKAQEEGAEAIPQQLLTELFLSVVLCHPNSDSASLGLTLLGDGPDPALPGAQPACFRMAVGCWPSGHGTYCIESPFISTHAGGTPPNLPFPSAFPPLCSGSSSLFPGHCSSALPPLILSKSFPSPFPLVFSPFCFPPVLYSLPGGTFLG